MAKFINNATYLLIINKISPISKGNKMVNLSGTQIREKFILDYTVDVNLSSLRQAFDGGKNSGEAIYIKTDGFEAATQNVNVPVEKSEYRLRIRLMNRNDPTFYFTPGAQRTGEVLQPSMWLRIVDGLKITPNGSGNEIRKPFSKPLEVIVKASELPSDNYAISVYKN